MKCFFFQIVSGLAVVVIFALLHQLLLFFIWHGLNNNKGSSFWIHGITTPIIFFAMGYPLSFLINYSQLLGCTGEVVGIAFGTGFFLYAFCFLYCLWKHKGGSEN